MSSIWAKLHFPGAEMSPYWIISISLPSRDIKSIKKRGHGDCFFSAPVRGRSGGKNGERERARQRHGSGDRREEESRQGMAGERARMPPGKSGVPGPRRRESNPQRHASGLEDGAGDWQRRFPPHLLSWFHLPRAGGGKEKKLAAKRQGLTKKKNRVKYQLIYNY